MNFRINAKSLKRKSKLNDEDSSDLFVKRLEKITNDGNSEKGTFLRQKKRQPKDDYSRLLQQFKEMWNDFAPLEDEVIRIKTAQEQEFKRKQAQAELQKQIQQKRRENAILVVQNIADNAKDSELESDLREDMSPDTQNILTPQSVKPESQKKIMAPKPPLFPKIMPRKSPQQVMEEKNRKKRAEQAEAEQIDKDQSESWEDVEEEKVEQIKEKEIKEPQKQIEVPKEQAQPKEVKKFEEQKEKQKAESKVLKSSLKMLQNLQNLKKWLQGEMRKPENQKQIGTIIGQVNSIMNKFSANHQSLKNAVYSTLEFLQGEKPPEFVKVTFLITLAKRIKQEVQKWAQNANIKEMILFFCLYCARVSTQVAHFSELLAAMTLKQCPLLIPKPFSRTQYKSEKEYRDALGFPESGQFLDLVPKLEIRSILFILLELFEHKYENVLERLDWIIKGEKHELHPVVLEGLVKNATSDLIRLRGREEIRQMYLQLRGSLDEWRKLVQVKIKEESDIVVPYIDRTEHWLGSFLKN